MYLAKTGNISVIYNDIIITAIIIKIKKNWKKFG